MTRWIKAKKLLFHWRQSDYSNILLMSITLNSRYCQFQTLTMTLRNLFFFPRTSRKEAKQFTEHSCQVYAIWNPQSQTASACQLHRIASSFADCMTKFVVNKFADFHDVLWVNKWRFCSVIGGIWNQQHLLLETHVREEWGMVWDICSLIWTQFYSFNMAKSFFYTLLIQNFI